MIIVRLIIIDYIFNNDNSKTNNNRLINVRLHGMLGRASVRVHVSSREDFRFGGGGPLPTTSLSARSARRVNQMLVFCWRLGPCSCRGSMRCFSEESGALQEECSSSAPLQLFSPRTQRRSRFPATSPQPGAGERPVVEGKEDQTPVSQPLAQRLDFMNSLWTRMTFNCSSSRFESHRSGSPPGSALRAATKLPFALFWGRPDRLTANESI